MIPTLSSNRTDYAFGTNDDTKAEDILSPHCGREKNRAYKYKKNNSDDGQSGYTVSSLKAVRHPYILFCIYGALDFFPA